MYNIVRVCMNAKDLKKAQASFHTMLHNCHSLAAAQVKPPRFLQGAALGPAQLL